MFHQAAVSFLFLLFSLQVTAQTTITYNCTDTPNACENFCYVTNCRGVANSYTKIAAGASPDANRRLSGVKRTRGRPAPCRDPTIPWEVAALAEYGPPLDTDEWPPASATQGGTGASLRCMPSGDNQRAGSKLRAVPRGSPFNIVLTELTYPGNIFCNSQCQTQVGGLDHQFQWNGATDTYFGPGPAIVSFKANSTMRRVRRTPSMQKAKPARFLTSRGDEITALTAAGQALDIREGSIIDAGFEDEAVVLKRLA